MAAAQAKARQASCVEKHASVQMRAARSLKTCQLFGPCAASCASIPTPRCERLCFHGLRSHRRCTQTAWRVAGLMQLCKHPWLTHHLTYPLSLLQCCKNDVAVGKQCLEGQVCSEDGGSCGEWWVQRRSADYTSLHCACVFHCILHSDRIWHVIRNARMRIEAICRPSAPAPRTLAQADCRH